MHQPRPVWSVAVVAPRGVFPLLFLCFVCPVSADARVACRRRRGFPLPPVAVHHFAAPPLKSTGLGTVGPALIAAVGDDLAVTVRHAPPFFHPSSRGWACAVGAGAAGWDGAVAAGWGRTPRDANCRVDYLTDLWEGRWQRGSRGGWAAFCRPWDSLRSHSGACASPPPSSFPVPPLHGPRPGQHFFHADDWSAGFHAHSILFTRTQLLSWPSVNGSMVSLAARQWHAHTTVGVRAVVVFCAGLTRGVL